jgi:putative membrane protein
MTALSDEDRQFVQQASMSNEMEVTLGDLAQDKAQSDQVKQFGGRLARDHEAAMRELQSSLGDARPAQQPDAGKSATDAARGGGATAANREPSSRPGAAGGEQMAQAGASGELEEMHQQMEQTEQKLEGMSGQAFDRAYLEEMVTHHQQDIQAFERASQSDNPQIRAFAARTLPTLRAHLQQAQQLRKQSQGEGSGSQKPR